MSPNLERPGEPGGRYFAEWGRVQTLRDRLEDEAAEAGPLSVRRGRILWAPVPVLPELPAFPDELRGLQCGTRTRAGSPCKRTDLGKSGRCKFHGGRSPGAPQGPGNGAWTGGRYSGGVREARRALRSLVTLSRFARLP